MGRSYCSSFLFTLWTSGNIHWWITSIPHQMNLTRNFTVRFYMEDYGCSDWTSSIRIDILDRKAGVRSVAVGLAGTSDCVFTLIKLEMKRTIDTTRVREIFLEIVSISCHIFKQASELGNRATQGWLTRNHGIQWEKHWPWDLQPDLLVPVDLVDPRLDE